MEYVIIAVYGVVLAAFAGFAAIVLWRIWKMDLSDLISEPGVGDTVGKASLSRFQFLLFTFVIAGLWLSLSIEANDFVDIPGGVLGLMGISGGSYLLSKGMSNTKAPAVDNKAAGTTGNSTKDADADKKAKEKTEETEI